MPRVARAVLPTDVAYGRALRTIMSAEAAHSLADLIAGERFSELLDEKSQAGLRAGGEVRAVAYLGALRVRQALDDAFRTLFRTVAGTSTTRRTLPAAGGQELGQAWGRGRPGATVRARMPTTRSVVCFGARPWN